MNRILQTKKLIVVLCVVGTSCSSQTGPVVGTPPEWSGTMTSAAMYSPVVQDTLVIDISLPDSYNADSTAHYPVLYMTDGYWRRGQHGPLHLMAQYQNVREMIVVGIGYPDPYDPNVVRVRDLIRDPDRFLEFIVHELIRTIDAQYRTTNERVLWGSSYGGYFGMYALFQYVGKTRGVFASYIIASPAALETTTYAGVTRDLFDLEELLSTKTSELNVNLYLGVGGREDPLRFLDPFNELVRILEGRHYTGLTMASLVYPGKDHYSVWEPTLYDGVRRFLAKN